jgi:hypothetical protein
VLGVAGRGAVRVGAGSLPTSQGECGARDPGGAGLPAIVGDAVDRVSSGV